ncbi:MAG: DNA-binding response regulator [Gammaproteobacteria bacterium]|nr:MAG: DNA-binding response regulator [Gammaproteobacteria bacterium]
MPSLISNQQSRCKVMIVDDERLARLELKRLLTKFDHIDVVAEANSAKQALMLMNTMAIDIVFIDIQMPHMTGLELAQTFANNIKFVFCTAFNEHAVDAFALNAIDYLVKPVNPERLKQCLDKITKLIAIEAESASATTSAKDSAEHTLAENYLPANYLPEKHGILLKFGDSSKIVRLQEIERFESIGNHVAVYCSVGKSYLHSSLSKVERRLDPSIFFKVSRSDIIRIDNIVKIEEGVAVGSLMAVMNSGQEIEVSRRQSQQLKQMFNVW